VVPICRLAVALWQRPPPPLSRLLAALCVAPHTAPEVLTDRLAALHVQSVQIATDNKRAKALLTDLRRADRQRQHQQQRTSPASTGTGAGPATAATTAAAAAAGPVDIYDSGAVSGLVSALLHNESVQSSQWTAQLATAEREASAVLDDCEKTRSALDEWYRQPAQGLVPWVTVDALSLAQWAERWRKCTAQLRELESRARDRLSDQRTRMLTDGGVGVSGGMITPTFAVSPTKGRL
jgi:hypothetical protein